jgi:hypothetical protein
MAGVTGPTTSLPGHMQTVHNGARCDRHPHRPAVKTITGETDSFGSETIDACQQCVDEIQAELKRRRESLQFCDWCKTQQTGCRDTRDYEEGSTGRVYTVCPSCRKRQNDEAGQDLEDMDSVW